MVLRQTKCPTCVNALEADMSNGLPNVYSLIGHKTNGGLIFPSASVLRLCKEVEKRFCILEQGATYLIPQSNYLAKHVTTPVLSELLESAK